MDAYIDTEDISEGIDSLSNTIDNIEQCISFIKQKIKQAGVGFTSINFERSSLAIREATASLEKMQYKLEIAQRYLKKLISHIDAYNRIRF